VAGWLVEISHFWSIKHLINSYKPDNDKGILVDKNFFNPLNAELNPICHLLAL
jgi:hypothetical protein